MLPVLALLVALLAPAPALPAQPSSALTVTAAPGPRGMTVRWFPHDGTRELIATVVRIDPSGARETLGQVRRSTTKAAQAENARLDSGGLGTLAEFGDLDLALTRGIAYIDSTAIKGARYRYDVTLSDG
ncbi:MAG: hypothetical protein ACYDGM_11520 [Vulcanimicrobiaceae bacterium]